MGIACESDNNLKCDVNFKCGDNDYNDGNNLKYVVEESIKAGTRNS